jgi:hypothetical protein
VRASTDTEEHAMPQVTQLTTLVQAPDTGIDARTALAHIRVGDSYRMVRLAARDIFHDETAGYVQFDIRITKPRRVVVKLAGDDTYSVEIGRIKRSRGDIEYVVLEQQHGIYCDHLGETVERMCVAQS